MIGSTPILGRVVDSKTGSVGIIVDRDKTGAYVSFGGDQLVLVDNGDNRFFPETN